MNIEELETLFDSAKFESNISGDKSEFNAINHTHYAYPSINGWSVSVLTVDGINIIERKKIVSAATVYEYAELSASQLIEVIDIEYDQYNSAAYSASLMDFAESVLQ